MHFKTDAGVAMLLTVWSTLFLPSSGRSIQGSNSNFEGPFADLIVRLVRQTIQRDLNEAVPLGFIYIEYPGQASPQDLWPLFKWEDVSATYAGHFFQVVGGNSASFGKPQVENAPQLSHVISKRIKATAQSEKKDVDIVPGQTSSRLWTGDDVGGMHTLLSTSFTMSGGEVRPQNYAVRVWKRVP